jgi:hypothetical protein
VIRCTSFPVGSYYIANDSKGRVRVFAREFGMTVRQIVERFGKNGEDLSNLSTPVKTAWEQGTLDVWFDVVHVIRRILKTTIGARVQVQTVPQLLLRARQQRA